jgi:hypothetical protein
VGNGEEDASIVDILLDINRVKEKPIYTMADDRPLILSDCVFEGIEFIDTLPGRLISLKATEDITETQSIELCVVKSISDYYTNMLLTSEYLNQN